MRTGIIGLTVWVSVLAIGLFGVPLAVAVYDYAIQDHRGNPARVARAAAITVAEEVYDGERIEDTYRHGSVVVAVDDENGAWMGGARVDGHWRELGQALDGEIGTGTDDQRFVVAVPVTHGADVIGAVQATTPRNVVLQRVVLAWGAMAGLAALAVAGSCLVGRRQARRLALPHPARPVPRLRRRPPRRRRPPAR